MKERSYVHSKSDCLIDLTKDGKLEDVSFLLSLMSFYSMHFVMQGCLAYCSFLVALLGIWSGSSPKPNPPDPLFARWLSAWHTFWCL